MSSGGAAHRGDDLLLGDQPLDRAAGDQPVVEALGHAHVGVLQVDQVQPRASPRPARRARGSPPAAAAWPASRGGRRSASGSRARSSSTSPQIVSTSAVASSTSAPSVFSTCFSAFSKYGALHVERGHLAAVGQVDQRLQRGVVADAVHGAHRLGQAQVVEPDAGLDHVEHERRGADLEQRGVLAHVRVADDDVQAAVLVGVGVRLVAGVDDAALERGLQPDLDLDVVGALRELVARLVARRAEADPARAADDLAGRRRTASGPATIAGTWSGGPSGSSRASRSSRPCRRRCSCRAGSAARRARWPRASRPPPSPAPPPCPRSRRRAGW